MSYEWEKKRSLMKSSERQACNETISARRSYYIATEDGNKLKEAPLCKRCYRLYQKGPHDIPSRILIEVDAAPCTICSQNFGSLKWVFSIDGNLVCGVCFVLWAKCRKKSVHECDYEPNFDKIFCRSCFRIVPAGKPIYTCKSHQEDFCGLCWDSGSSVDVDLKDIDPCTTNTIYERSQTHQDLQKANKLLLIAAIMEHHDAMLKVLDSLAANPSMRYKAAVEKFKREIELN